MSTNHTQHYHLSQWERTDKVLMDDFNADNAKIDAALFNHPSGELIAQVTVEEETAQLELDVSGLDWSRYLALVMKVETSAEDGVKITADNAQDKCLHIYNTQMNHIGGNATFSRLYQASHFTVLMPVFYDGGLLPTMLAFGTGLYSSLSAGGAFKPWNQIKTLRLFRDELGAKFVPGDRLVLWGVK